MKSKSTINVIIACLVGLYSSQFWQASAVAENGNLNITNQELIRTFSEDTIRDTAKLITVRLYVVDRPGWEETQLHTIDISGSGVIVAKKEIKREQEQQLYLYLVLTNNHVSKVNSSFYLETHDGLIHHAFVHPQPIFEQDKASKVDLGLVGFYSPHSYAKAVLPEYKSPFLPVDSSNFKAGSNLWVGGFPCELTSLSMDCPGDFMLTSGTGYKVNKPLEDGYQLAFTNETKEGSSGGSILDNQGKLVGINGRGKIDKSSPQYQYADGSGIPREIEQYGPLALGIPIEYYLELDEDKLLDSVEELEPPKINNIIVIPRDESNGGEETPSYVLKPPFNQFSLGFLLGGISLLCITPIGMLIVKIFKNKTSFNLGEESSQNNSKPSIVPSPKEGEAKKSDATKNQEQLMAEFWYKKQKYLSSYNFIEKIIFELRPNQNNSTKNNSKTVTIELSNYYQNHRSPQFIPIEEINCLIEVHIPNGFYQKCRNLEPVLVCLPKDKSFRIDKEENKYKIYRQGNNELVKLYFQ